MVCSHKLSPCISYTPALDVSEGTVHQIAIAPIGFPLSFHSPYSSIDVHPLLLVHGALRFSASISTATLVPCSENQGFLPHTPIIPETQCTFLLLFWHTINQHHTTPGHLDWLHLFQCVLRHLLDRKWISQKHILIHETYSNKEWGIFRLRIIFINNLSPFCSILQCSNFPVISNNLTQRAILHKQCFRFCHLSSSPPEYFGSHV